MRKWTKAAVALGCAAALAGGSALAAAGYTTRILEARFMDIQMKVNGQEVTLTDSKGEPAEPFVIDGTTYVPARALGEALGKDVAWDAETNTVSVGLAPMMEDARQLVDIVESSHAALLLDAVPEGYEAAKAAFLTAAEDPDCSVADFTMAAMAYTASLSDGHTRVDPFGGAAQAMLEVDWSVDGDKLLLSDGAEVAQVAGLPVADLFAWVDGHVPAENRSGVAQNRGEWLKNTSVLSLLGGQLQEDGGVQLTLADGAAQTAASALPEQEEVPTAETKAIDGVFYLDFNQCVDDEVFQQARAALEDAVKKGTKQIIIDIRGNGGGNSDTGVQLLKAMGMEPPSYGATVRYSPLAQLQRGYPQGEGSDTYPPTTATAKTNPKVELVVLTDEDTYSSATMLAVYVRDGKLGSIIGRASANMPSHFGDLLFYQLDHTGLTGTVSHKRFLRPDQSAEPTILVPDMETAVGEDALERALEFLSK